MLSIAQTVDRRLPSCYTACRRGVAQSGLARSVWDAEVGGPNPLTPTINPSNSPNRIIIKLYYLFKGCYVIYYGRGNRTKEFIIAG